MKNIITSADPISEETKLGIVLLKEAIAVNDAVAAQSILNGKKYDRPVQFEDKELIDKVIADEAKNHRITVMTLDQFVEEVKGLAKEE